MPDPVADIDRWMAEAAALPNDDFIYNLPIHVFLAEATDVATFHQMFWESSTRNRVSLPGLKSAMIKGVPSLLGPSTGEEILSLQRAAHELRTRHQVAAGLSVPGPAERGRRILAEIQAVLAYRFDDGVLEPADAHLAKIDADHANDPDSHDALALALEDYARFGKLHRETLDGLGEFSAALLDEALVVADEVRRLPSAPALATPDAKAALALRNRFFTLLAQRVSAVRAAARFVFRDHPDIARLATSAYGRRRKAAERSASKAAAGEVVSEDAE